ncbi:MAG: hypothetical protein H0T62_05775 [Parachlamydiaceae bacterium]|nr:hypothetical protein [Parachlamydiaceae bacterium]
MSHLEILKERLKQESNGTEIWSQLQKLEQFERRYRELESHYAAACEQLVLLEKQVEKSSPNSF